MTVYMQSPTTYCVGRFLIGAPPQAKDVSGSYSMQMATLTAKTVAPQSVQDLLRVLDHELSGRESLLRSERTLYTHQSKFYARSEPAPNVRSLLYAENESGAKAIDGYIAKPGGIFEFKTTAYEESRIAQFHDFLRDVEPRIRVRSPSELPTSPGFCFDNGFLAMNPERGEDVSWGWELSDRPDVTFGISIRTNGDDVSPGLLDRETDIFKETGPWISDIRTIRKRRFDLSGMKAQEWSIAIATGKPEYNLELEIPGRPNDNAAPSIHMSVQVGGHKRGGYRPPSLSEGEALALWDAIIETLRPRPGAF